MLACDVLWTVLLWDPPSFLRLFTSCCPLINTVLSLLLRLKSPCVWPPSKPISAVTAGLFLLPSWLFKTQKFKQLFCWILMQFYGCRYIYSDRTPFEKLPDGYFCPGNRHHSMNWTPFSPFFPDAIFQICTCMVLTYDIHLNLNLTLLLFHGSQNWFFSYPSFSFDFRSSSI